MSKLSHLHVKAQGLVALTDVIIPLRGRTEDASHKAFVTDELAPDIAANGLIQAIVLQALDEPSEGKNMYGDVITGSFILLAGMSRMQAFDLLKEKEIPYSTMNGEISMSQFYQREMSENDIRHEMKWQDRCVMLCRVHEEETKKASKKYKSWTQAATGRLLNVSAATIGNALLPGKFLEAGDTEIWSAPSLEAAQKILLGRKLDAAKAKLVEQTVNLGSLVVKTERLSGPVLTKGISLELVSEAQVSKPKVSIPLSTFLFHDSCVTSDGSPAWMSRQKPESFDLVFTDHPYGIDMKNLADINEIEITASEHEVDENVAQMPHFINESFRLLKKDSYLLFFMDLKHWEKLVAWGEAAGFQVMPYPLIWGKTSNVKNRSGHAWWPKGHETLMVMRKGKPTLFNPPQHSIFMCGSDAERKRYGHPFSKPFEFCKWVLGPLIIPGATTVLDPYAGGGSMVCAALALGCKVTALEKVEKHYHTLIHNVQEQYKLMLPNKEVTFT